MRCQHCEAEFQAKTVRRRFCTEKCRKASWQAERDRDLALVVDSMTRDLERLRRLQRGKSQP